MIVFKKIFIMLIVTSQVMVGASREIVRSDWKPALLQLSGERDFGDDDDNLVDNVARNIRKLQKQKRVGEELKTLYGQYCEEKKLNPEDYTENFRIIGSILIEYSNNYYQFKTNTHTQSARDAFNSMRPGKYSKEKGCKLEEEIAKNTLPLVTSPEQLFFPTYRKFTRDWRQGIIKPEIFRFLIEIEIPRINSQCEEIENYLVQFTHVSTQDDRGGPLPFFSYYKTYWKANPYQSSIAFLFILSCIAFTSKEVIIALKKRI